jgi:hypothetical protein
MNRSKCVICFEQLAPLYERKGFPISISPPLEGSTLSQDLFRDQNFTYCTSCSCVQFGGKLIDPTVLYANAHNNTGDTPTWKEHHAAFKTFVLNTLPQSILEIGGTGPLYSLIRKEQPDIFYASLDICSPTQRLDGITYLQGNCESFNFKGHSTVVMSHVFEHLYNPRSFIENMANASVENVVLTFPNMLAMLKVKNPNILHNEHTYFVDRLYTEWMFGNYGYKLGSYVEFNDHSIFLHFQLGSGPMEIALYNRPEIPIQMKEIYEEEKTRLSNIHVKENSFFAPAGLYGQLFYYFSKPDIIGFLDNDTAKQGKRVYGTPYYVFPFNTVVGLKKVTVYVWGGPYRAELLKQLSQYPNVEVIEV